MKAMRFALLPVVLAATSACIQTVDPLPPPRPQPPSGVIIKKPSRTAVAEGLELNPRSAWAYSEPVRSKLNPLGRVYRITVHHEARLCYNKDADFSAMRIRGIQKAHFNNGWADIGYHFIIDYGGQVWEGRQLKYQGAHVSDNNGGNIGVVLLGDFNQQRPSPEQKKTLKRLLEYLKSTYNVPISRIYTHRELKPTDCPGDVLQAYMDQIRGLNR